MQRKSPSAVWKDLLISMARHRSIRAPHTTLAHYIISDTCVLCKSFWAIHAFWRKSRRSAAPERRPAGQSAAIRQPRIKSLRLVSRALNSASRPHLRRRQWFADSAHPAMLKIYLAAFAPADGTDSTDHGRQFDRRVGQAVGVALQPHRRSVPPDYAVCHQRIARAHKQQIAHRDVRVAHSAHEHRVAAADQRRHAPGHDPGRALALDGKALAEKIAGDSRRHLPRGFP